jgi:hypothetical protein
VVFTGDTIVVQGTPRVVEFANIVAYQHWGTGSGFMDDGHLERVMHFRSDLPVEPA